MEHLINASLRPNRCHCPICERPDQKVAVTGIWIAPDGIRVCRYGICPVCTTLVQRSPESAIAQEMTNIEAWLLERYPETAKRLPKGYVPVSTRPPKKKENQNE